MLRTCKHSPNRIIQALCEHGADATLTDIEGNTPRDLAQKNGQYKCAKYLAAAMKQKVPRGANRTLVVRTVCHIQFHRLFIA